MEPPYYHRWIEPLQYLNHDNDEIHIGCPNNFFRGWVKRHHEKTIRNALAEVSGREMTLYIDIVSNGEKDNDENASNDQLLLPNIRLVNPWKPRFNPMFTFDRFVVGPCNEFAYSAAKTVARERETRYNPLYLYADVGLGKSHLSSAVGNFINNHSNEDRVYYLSAEEFVTELVRCIMKKKVEDFKEKYRRGCDVLVIDGIHFLSGKEKTQLELTHTLDALYNYGKRVILTSCKVPKELPSMGEDLKSRLSCGLMIYIKPPDIETRRNILLAKATREGLSLSENVLEYLAQNVEGSVRRLESALINLMAQGSLLKRPIDMDLAKEVVKCVAEKKERVVTIDDVKKCVNRYFQLQKDQLESKSRKRSITYPRQIAMYLSRTHTGESLEAIGKAFNRDHASVIHSIASISKGMKEKAMVRSHVDYLSKKLTT
jgi:chromosomal replication initiator protein